MRLEPAIANSIEKSELEGAFAGVLPDRESLMALSLTVAPVVNVTPVVVVGSAIAVQAGTIGSTVTASLSQWVTVP